MKSISDSFDGCSFIVEGTQEKEFRGIPATNKDFETVGMNIFHFQDNKIKEGWVVVDALTAAIQLGAIKSTSSEADQKFICLSEMLYFMNWQWSK